VTAPAPRVAMARPTPLKPGAWYALFLVAAVQTTSLLDRNILAILAPSIKADLKIGDAEMGLLYGTVFALFYALFSLPLGRLADGWIRTRLLAVAILFWSLATSAAAFATGFAPLALSRLGVGIGEAAAQPAGTSLVYDYFPSRRRGLVMAVLAAAIAIGLGGSSILGGFAAGWWDHRYAGTGAPFGFHGWQFAFLVASLPGIVIAALLWRLREPERGAADGIPALPDPHPFRASFGLLGAVTPGVHFIALLRGHASRRDWIVNLLALAVIIGGWIVVVGWANGFSPRPPIKLGGAAISPHALQWGVVGFGLFVVVNLLQHLHRSDRPAFAAIATSPSLVLCMLIGALQSVINYGNMSFTPSFIMKSFHQSPAETGLQFGLLAAVLGIVGPMISGPLSDWVSARWPGGGRVWVTTASLGISPLIAPWVYASTTSAEFYLRFVVYSLALTMWMPPLYAIMYDQVLPRMRGVTASTYIVISTITGLGMGPYFVGMVSDATGNLGGAILTVNWVAVPIVAMLVLLAARVGRDQGGLVARARAAGEAI